jgi:hypothetical protein
MRISSLAVLEYSSIIWDISEKAFGKICRFHSNTIRLCCMSSNTMTIDKLKRSADSSLYLLPDNKSKMIFVDGFVQLKITPVIL